MDLSNLRWIQLFTGKLKTNISINQLAQLAGIKQLLQIIRINQKGLESSERAAFHGHVPSLVNYIMKNNTGMRSYVMTNEWVNSLLTKD